MRKAILIAFLLIAGCRGEPDFDARYERADKEIESRAQEIDAQLEAGNGKEEAGPADPQAEGT